MLEEIFKPYKWHLITLRKKPLFLNKEFGEKGKRRDTAFHGKMLKI